MRALNQRAFVSREDGRGVLLQAGTIRGEDVERHFFRQWDDELHTRVAGAVSTAEMGKPRCLYSSSIPSQPGALDLFRLADPRRLGQLTRG